MNGYRYHKKGFVLWSNPCDYENTVYLGKRELTVFPGLCLPSKLHVPTVIVTFKVQSHLKNKMRPSSI